MELEKYFSEILSSKKRQDEEKRLKSLQNEEKIKEIKYALCQEIKKNLSFLEKRNFIISIREQSDKTPYVEIYFNGCLYDDLYPCITKNGKCNKKYDFYTLDLINYGKRKHYTYDSFILQLVNGLYDKLKIYE